MPSPANDDFANAQVLAGDEGVLAPIQIDDATTEPGEPVPGDSGSIEQSIWFKLIPTVSGRILVTTRGSETTSPGTLDTVLAVYTGTNFGDMVEVASDDDFWSDVNSLVVFDGTASTTYWIQAGTFSGGENGTIVLTYQLAAGDLFTDPLVLATDKGSLADLGLLDRYSQGYSLDPGEPAGSAGFEFGGSNSIWLEWTPSASGRARFAVPGIDYDGDPFVSTVTAWTGSALVSLVEVASVSGDNATLLFDVTAGVTYRIQIEPFDDSVFFQGIFSFSWALTLPAARTHEGRAWKWIITDLRSSRVLAELTSIATDITTSRLLAASWPAALTVPSDDPRVRTIYLQFDEHPEWDEPFVAKDIRALIGFRNTGDPFTEPLWKCAYAGMVKQVTDRVADGVPQTTINCWDARKYLEFLPLVDADGDLPGQSGNTFTATKANVIARTALQNWITNNPGCLAETLFDLSSGLDEDCAELTMTFGRGTTINDVWTQLEQAGAIDIVLDPVFDQRTRPGCLAVVNFEVQHGSARPAAIFSWDRSPRSLPEISRMEDGLKDANTIQDYTDDVEPAVAQVATDSVARFGEYWAMRAWPGQTDTDAVAAFAAEELLFRKDGQTTVEASPAAPRSLQPVEEYDIGDRVPVYASERLRKPIAATMRIYAIPFTIDESAVETVSSLVVSADAVT